ncbi:MAG: hypothetical protein GXO82_08825, partial [Chlorobi bacterium]|nr:hypothetical protein [Chlorobiota bacterium]
MHGIGSISPEITTIRALRGRSLILFLAVLVNAHAVSSQPRLVPGPVDTTAYPALSFPFRVIYNNTLFIPDDSTAGRLAENGTDLPFTIDCPQQRRLPVSVAIGVERSLVNILPEARDAARAFIRR